MDLFMLNEASEPFFTFFNKVTEALAKKFALLDRSAESIVLHQSNPGTTGAAIMHRIRTKLHLLRRERGDAHSVLPQVRR
jgi:gentisate 1,2-dioxygenase